MATQPVELTKPIEPVQTIEKRARRRPYAWTIKLRRLGAKLIFNIAPFAIALGFLWIQIQIGASGGWLAKVEIGMSVVVEIGLVFIWSLFIRND